MKVFRKLKWKFQKMKKGYCDQDIWGMDYWFFEQFPKMLRELRETKHGVPFYTFPEVDQFPKGWLRDEIKNLEKWKLKNGYDGGKVNIYDGNTDSEYPNPDRWWIIISRMIWCFERANPDFELPNKYWDEIWDEYYCKNNNENIPKELHQKFLKQSERNADFREKCKNEGIELLKTYIYTLWD